MKALYAAPPTLYFVVEDDGNSIKLEPVNGTSDQAFWIEYGDAGLTIDPTDDEVKQARADYVALKLRSAR